MGKICNIFLHSHSLLQNKIRKHHFLEPSVLHKHSRKEFVIKSPNEFGLKPAIKKPKILWQYAKVPKCPKAQVPKGPKAKRPKGQKAQRPKAPKPQKPWSTKKLKG